MIEKLHYSHNETEPLRFENIEFRFQKNILNRLSRNRFFFVFFLFRYKQNNQTCSNKIRHIRIFVQYRMLISISTCLGAHQLSSPTDVQQSIKVEKIFVHERYSWQHDRNDIALIRLKTPATLSDKVNTVCLPAQGSRIPAGKNCYITGTVFGHIYRSFCSIRISLSRIKYSYHFFLINHGYPF